MPQKTHELSQSCWCKPAPKVLADGSVEFSHRGAVAIHREPRPTIAVPEYKAAVGKVLRRAREAARLSQGELTARTGLSEFTIQQMDSGRTVPYLHNIQTVCRALGISLAVFDDLPAVRKDAAPSKRVRRVKGGKAKVKRAS